MLRQAILGLTPPSWHVSRQRPLQTGAQTQPPRPCLDFPVSHLRHLPHKPGCDRRSPAQAAPAAAALSRRFSQPALSVDRSADASPSDSPSDEEAKPSRKRRRGAHAGHRAGAAAHADASALASARPASNGWACARDGCQLPGCKARLCILIPLNPGRVLQLAASVRRAAIAPHTRRLRCAPAPSIASAAHPLPGAGEGGLSAWPAPAQQPASSGASCAPAGGVLTAQLLQERRARASACCCGI